MPHLHNIEGSDSDSDDYFQKPRETVKRKRVPSPLPPPTTTIEQRRNQPPHLTHHDDDDHDEDLQNKGQKRQHQTSLQRQPANIEVIDLTVDSDGTDDEEVSISSSRFPYLEISESVQSFDHAYRG